ncbi:hypothetical protein HYS54_02445 [Candidatus Micrarchaeota archaeon]|nr:hypothetical protein [Candidatus Micrarchaeota archaeon]
MRPANSPIVVQYRDELLKLAPAKRNTRLVRIESALRKQGRFLDLLHLKESLPTSRRRIRGALKRRC